MNPLTLLAALACSGVALAQWAAVLGASRAASGLPPSDFAEQFPTGYTNPTYFTDSGSPTLGYATPPGGFTGGDAYSIHMVTNAQVYCTYTGTADHDNVVIRLAIYFSTFPTDFCSILNVEDNSGNNVLDIYTDGSSTTVRSATNASITLSGGTWLDLELKINRNATSYVRVNGAGEQSFTARNNATRKIEIGAMTYHVNGVVNFDFFQLNNSATGYISGP